MNENCTVKKLREWLAALPPEFDDADVEGVIANNSQPYSAKRVIAYKSRDGTLNAICVNPMGTHLSDDWGGRVEIVSVLQ